MRASVGSLGNERISDAEFPYQAAINFGNSYMYDKGSQSVTAVQNAAQYYYAFNNITWETTTTYDIGIDLAMFDSHLSFTGDYYYKKTSDMLLTLGFPSYAGFSAPKQNAGDMHTRGWEFEVNWRDKIGDVSYGVSFNLSDYRSRMGYLGDRRTIVGDKIYEKGLTIMSGLCTRPMDCSLLMRICTIRKETSTQHSPQTIRQVILNMLM